MVQEWHALFRVEELLTILRKYTTAIIPRSQLGYFQGKI